MQRERYTSQINHNFGTICHTEVCLTFQIPNIYLGLGFEFGPNRTRELSVRNSWSKITLEKKEEKGCHEQIEVVFQFRPILCNIKRLIAVHTT